jgi:SH3-like domain-containing protein
MKINFYSILIAMILTAARADQPAVPPPAVPPPTAPEPAPAMTNAPVTPVEPAPAKTPKKKAAVKHVKKEPVAELKTTPLVPGTAVVVAHHVNVRGQAKTKSEVITRMTNGEPVMVIEEIQLKHSGVDEPSAWAKIVLPEKAHVWVHTSFIDAANKTVKPKKLNLRGGPGENFSILGTLQQGDTVKEVGTKGDWTEIEATPGAYAFMAAQYLSQEPAILAATLPPSTTATVAETPAVAPTTTEAPVEAPVLTNEPASELTNTIASAPETPVVAEPPPPRIVQHEGLVRETLSIQAPTEFQLISPDNFKVINYLYTDSKKLDLKRYKGLHIIVTGEEGLDERWKNTPVITIQRIQVID